jgi:hypothetical protein
MQMSAFYELWDLESGNIIGDFDTESEALAVVRNLLAVNANSFADLLSLGCTEADGTFRIVAQGRPLAARADREANRAIPQSRRTVKLGSEATRRLA